MEDTVPIQDNNGRIINQELLEQIEETAPLTPRAARKLAIFFGKAEPETLQSLRDALNYYALAKMVTDPRAEDVMQQINHVNASIWDIIEDSLDGAMETSENPNDIEAAYKRSTFRWIPFNGIGLVIEHRKCKTCDKKLFVIVGVSPNPERLPDS